MDKYIAFAFFLMSLVSCKGQIENAANTNTQDEIIEKYLKNGAWNHHYLTKEWNEWINKGIQADSTIAYLWQQKALPFWKQKKYSLAIKYYDKAVKYDRQRWLSRLAFLKCVFAKDYEGALTDIKTYIKEYGTTLEQDHSLEFYMGLCYLQLNQFDKAFETLNQNVKAQEIEHGTDWVHYLDRYYLAIAYYEQSDYVNANSELDKVLKQYPGFSDAQYYKSICLNYLGKKEEAMKIADIGKSNYHMGKTFNEDSNIYEMYPYQITWQWNVLESSIIK